MNTVVDRRQFLISATAVGGSLAIGVRTLRAGEARSSPIPRVNNEPWLPPETGGVEVNPWVIIGADSSVTIVVNQSEVGQGVLTSNPMMICEELECDWSKVRSVYADPNRHVRENNLYDHLRTDSSSSVRLGRELYQKVGANARERLRLAASLRWDCLVSEVVAKDGMLTRCSTGQTLTSATWRRRPHK